MTFVDAFLALVAIGVLWSFRQTIAKQLTIVYSHRPEASTVVAGLLGLLIVVVAYYSYYNLASMFLGWELIWVYNVLFLLFAFAAGFRLVETILVGLTGRHRIRK
jgi:hypothetical protein